MTMHEANVQRNFFYKTLQIWRNIAQNHFKRLQKCLALWKQNIKKMRVDSNLFHGTVLWLIYFLKISRPGIKYTAHGHS